MRIDSSGKVGIGTTSPQQPLHLHTASSSAANMVFSNTTTGSGASDGFVVGLDGAERGQIFNQENTDLLFGTNNQERMRIDSSGNVGIGTTSPSTNLHVKGADGAAPKITISEGTSESAIRSTASGTSSDLRFMTSVSGTQTTKMMVDYSGNVGIGTTSPSYILDVNGDGGAAFSATTNSTNGQLSIVGKNSSGSVSAISRIKSHPDGSSNQSHMAFETRNSSNSMVEAMRINSSGSVGIGSTSPLGKLSLEISS